MNLAPFALFALATVAAAQQTCSSSVVATSCGPTLTVAFTPVGNNGNHRLDLTCSGLDPNGIGLMVWGVNQTMVQLPGCPMLTEFVWGHIVNLDATGSHTWSRSWPASIDGYYFIQFGSVTFGNNGFTVLSTDLMRAECNG